MTKQEREKFEPAVAKLQKARKTRVAAEAAVQKAIERRKSAQAAEETATAEYRQACKLLIEGEPVVVTETHEYKKAPEGGPFNLGDTIHVHGGGSNFDPLYRIFYGR